jgi:hypothetical protein
MVVCLVAEVADVSVTGWILTMHSGTPNTLVPPLLSQYLQATGVEVVSAARAASYNQLMQFYTLRDSTARAAMVSDLVVEARVAARTILAAAVR